MRLAFSYLRYSSRRQAKGISKIRQLTTAKEACDRNGWQLDKELSFADEGVSAFRGKNFESGKLGAFLAAVDSGRVPKGSALIIEQLDRLTREKLQKALTIIHEILSRGIDVYTTKDGNLYTYGDLDDFAKRIQIETTLWLAHLESDKKSYHGKKIWKHKSESAGQKRATRWSPSWIVPTTTGFEINEAKAAIVRSIFAWADSGIGVQSIQRRLNKAGIAPISKRENSGYWTPTYINRLLRNRAVFGEYTLLGKTHERYYPAVVALEQFDRVQAHLDSRNFHRGRIGKDVANLFAGLLFCLRDRCSMRVIMRGRCKYEKRIVSTKAYQAVKGCRFVTFPYEPLEHTFLQVVRELDPADLLPPSVDGAMLRTRLHAVEAQLEKVTAQIVAGKELVTLQRAAERLEREQKRLTRELQESATASKVLDGLGSVIEQLASATGEERYELRLRLQSAIRRIVKEMLVLIHFEETLCQRHKKKTITPRETIRRATGCVVGINFQGGGYRTFVVGEVPKTVRAKWGLVGRETMAVRRPA